MKWIRTYSIIGISLSILMSFIAFYIYDFLPVLYNYYTGHNIEAGKLNKIMLFSKNIIFELKIYSIFSLFTFSAMYFVKSIKQYFALLLFFILVHFIFIAEIGELTVFRRLYQLLLMIPLLWMFFEYFKFKNEVYEKKVTNGFLYISLLCIVLPGVYFPPFFNGIAGWTAQIDKTKNVSIYGMYLVRNDGKEIIFSRSIVNPINFLARLNGYTLRQNNQEIDKLFDFYKTVYKKRFHLLKDTQTPNQKNLGRIAYPGHNPYGKFDYTEFPPDSIKEIKISTKYYTWDKKFVEEKVIARKDWK